MIKPKNEIEDLLLSVAKNCEKLIEQTHRKPEETLEFKMLKPRKTFHLNPPIHTKGDWMLAFVDLEVYNSIFNITKENSKLELFTDTSDEFSFEKLKDELEEILSIPNITGSHLEDETLAPHLAETYWKLRSHKLIHDGYIILIMGYARYPFRDFESYLRIVIGLEEDNIQLILKQYFEKFVTYELDPGNYTNEDLQEAVYPLGDHEDTLQIEYDDLNKKVKLILTRFGSTFGTLRFDEKSFFHTIIGFAPYWDYKPTNAIHADSPGVYTGTIQYKKITKSVLKTITFYLEDNNNEVVNFNGEMLTFTLQMINI